MANNGNGNYPATSIDAWNEFNSEVIQVSERLAIEVAGYDVMALLTGGRNPILAIIQDMVERDEQGKPQLGKMDESALIDQPEKLEALSKALDQLLVDIVINPPLKEQGHENGYSLVRIPFNYKMKVFEHISGGDQALTAAERFHQAETASLVVAQPSAGLRATSEQD
jgi:hypothetical protein